MTPILPVPVNPFGTVTLGVAVILGLLSLFFGRQLFYVFVALVGFGAGFQLSRLLLAGAPYGQTQFGPTAAGWLPLIAGIVVGVLVALLAVVLQRPIAAIAAFVIFFAAGRQIFAAAPDTVALVLAVVLGLVGLVLVWIFFDWGLIVSSALVGAATLTAVARSLTVLPPLVALLLFAILVAVGILFQARNLRGGPI